ncbi:MAG TPA: acyltransferase [Acidimicrobiales bacterium]|nr:acyltransferase [Acidimicrobiales bacterium]
MSNRLVRLDGLRGVAVLSVVLFHAGSYLVPSAAPNLLPGGFLGVDLFFVLSGFLMTSILLEPSQSYGRFYVRRVARIFPALYVFLAGYLLYTWAEGGPGVTGIRSYVLIALGMGNWSPSVGTTLPFGLAQTWSLGVEEQLYLLWPLVVVLYGRTRPNRLRHVCVVGIAGSLVLKALLWHHGVPATQIYSRTDARLDDFLVGAFVATLWHGREHRIAPRHLGGLTATAGAFLAVCLAVAHPYSSPWLYEGGFTAVAVCCGIILYACLHRTAATGFADSRALRSLGRYSYAAYLWHPAVFLGAAQLLPGDLFVRVAAATVALAAVVVASTRWVEEPLRRLASRPTRPARPVTPVLTLLPT